MFLMVLEQLNMAPIIAIICAAVLVVILIVINILFFLKRKRKPKIKVNQDFIQQLLQALGTKENMLDAKNVNGRVILEVEDVDQVNFEELKKLSSAGVFVTNHSIKMLFAYDSKLICTALSEIIKEK